MNRLGLGTNNFRIIGSASPPAMERYYITDCVGFFSGNLTTIEYPQGTFQIEDRVTYEYEGISTFGFVNDISTESVDDIAIYSTGVHNADCYDSILYLNDYSDYDGNYVEFRVEIQSVDANFVSTNSEYPIEISYYNSGIAVVWISDDDGGYYDEVGYGWSGSLILNNYNFGADGEYEIIYEAENTGDEVTGLYDVEVYLQLYFTNNAINYSANECYNDHFLRLGSTQNGSAIFANYRNDNC